ncbi:AMP-binding enzyme [Massilia sp. LXY-6]|uniref:AMP-binding enzyme n=1 Tax=Massilia sp. LXY-6 TaxID=3379823 RepID=UPI003EE2D62C
MRNRATPAWWNDQAAVRRFVSDLLAAELAQARPGRMAAPLPWPPECDFVRDLGADSLELLGMGTALAEALHLERADVDARLLATPRLDAWVEAARAGLCAAAGVDGAPMSFRTSGSSGSPKRCTHALALLWQETLELARLQPGRRRILSVVPSHHIYGFLFTILLPRALGSGDAPAEVRDLRAATPGTLLREARPGDLVVAHPGWWEQAARLAPRFAAGVAGVSSTAPCPDPLARGLADAGLRLLQVYGSSETAGIGWREEAGVPFSLLPHWSRVDAPAELARALPDGGMARYPLQDKLEWEDERRFRPAGRVDAAVQVGGVNVFPPYVAEVLRMHPAVADAAVRLMRPDEGRRLKAFVVPAEARDDASLEALRGQLLDWCAARLATPERPAAISFGARLPRQASGKPADWIIDAM